MRSRSLFPLLAVLAMLTAACGSSSVNPTGPSPAHGSPGRHSQTFDDYPVTEGISCPSAAPAFTASWDSSNTTDLTIKVEFQRMPQADFIRVYVSRRDVNNVFQPQPFSPVVLGDHGETYGQFAVLDEGVYALQVATVTCGQQQNLSDVVIVSIGGGTPAPAPPSTPEEQPQPPSEDPPSDEQAPAPTCEQLNPPSYSVSSAVFNFKNDGSLNAGSVGVKFFNAGNWRVELVASSSNSASDTESERRTGGTVKDSESVTLTCGQQSPTKTVHENQHEWKYWWYRIVRNNTVVFTSQRFQK